MCIVVGSYEQLLLGYQIGVSNEEPKGNSATGSTPGLALVNSFASHAHCGSIRTLATAKSGFLASGGTDEVIQLFQLQKQVEFGNIVGHENTVTALAFHADSYLFSGSADGKICFWSIRNGWRLAETLKAHKSGVVSLAVHPSGRVMLSTGCRESLVKTWDLSSARMVACSNHPEVGKDFRVQWSADGRWYFLFTERICVVFDAGNCARVAEFLPPEETVICCVASDSIRIYIGLSDGKIGYSKLSPAGIKFGFFYVGSSRIKSIVSLEGFDFAKLKTSSESSGDRFIASGSSDGDLRLWKFPRISDNDICGESENSGVILSVPPECLAKVNCGVRITCLAFSQATKPLGKDDSSLRKRRLAKKKVEYDDKMTENISDQFTTSDFSVPLNNNGDRAIDYDLVKNKKKSPKTDNIFRKRKTEVTGPDVKTVSDGALNGASTGFRTKNKAVKKKKVIFEIAKPALKPARRKPVVTVTEETTKSTKIGAKPEITHGSKKKKRKTSKYDNVYDDS